MKKHHKLGLSLGLALSLSSCQEFAELFIPPVDSGLGRENNIPPSNSTPEVDYTPIKPESSSEPTGKVKDDQKVVSGTFSLKWSDTDQAVKAVTFSLSKTHLPPHFEPGNLQLQRLSPEGHWNNEGFLSKWDPQTQEVTYEVDNPLRPGFTTQASRFELYRVAIHLLSNAVTVQRAGSPFRISYYPSSYGYSWSVKKDSEWQGSGRNDAPDLPNFVEDLNAALNEAYPELLKLKTSDGTPLFKTPDGPIDVLITDLGKHALGNSVLGSSVQISAQNIESLLDLRRTAAHELVHYFQGQYYSWRGTFTGRQNRWFIEACAQYFAAESMGLSPAERYALYTDNRPGVTGSYIEKYLSVPLAANDQDSYYAAGHFLEWLTDQSQPSLIPDTIQASTASDFTALNTQIRNSTTFTDLGDALFQYSQFILTQPETMNRFGRAVKNAMKGFSDNYTNPTPHQFPNHLYTRINRSMPALSSNYFTIVENIPGDNLLVLAPHASSEELKTYLYLTTGSRDINYQGLRSLSTTPSLFQQETLTIPHFGTKPKARLLDVWLTNTSTSNTHLADMDIYLLKPPEIIEDKGRNLTWSLETKGHIPQRFLKGFQVYYQDHKGNPSETRWQPLGDIQDIEWGQKTQSFRISALPTTLSGYTRSFRVTVIDKFDNEWPNTRSQVRSMQLRFVSRSKGSGSCPAEPGERYTYEVKFSGLSDQDFKWEQESIPCTSSNSVNCTQAKGSISRQGNRLIYQVPSGFKYDTTEKIKVYSVADPSLTRTLSFSAVVDSGNSCKNDFDACVRPGTLVTLNNGKRQPIETLKVGQKIWAYDETAQTPAEAVIEQVLVHHKTMPVYQLSGGDGDELQITGNHKVLTQEKGWIPVEELTPGMTLHQKDHVSGEFAPTRVLSIIRETTASELLYNLKTTKGNYFANDILIHNKCLAKGSWIDTPEGPKAVETLKVGDTVWTRSQGKKAPTRVTKVFQKDTILPHLPGVVLGPHSRVTINHKVFWNQHWTRADKLPHEKTEIPGTVYDLHTEQGHYLSEGILMGEGHETS